MWVRRLECDGVMEMRPEEGKEREVRLVAWYLCPGYMGRGRSGV